MNKKADGEPVLDRMASLIERTHIVWSVELGDFPPLINRN